MEEIKRLIGFATLNQKNPCNIDLKEIYHRKPREYSNKFSSFDTKKEVALGNECKGTHKRRLTFSICNLPSFCKQKKTHTQYHKTSMSKNNCKRYPKNPINFMYVREKQSKINTSYSMITNSLIKFPSFDNHQNKMTCNNWIPQDQIARKNKFNAIQLKLWRSNLIKINREINARRKTSSVSAIQEREQKVSKNTLQSLTEDYSQPICLKSYKNVPQNKSVICSTRHISLSEDKQKNKKGKRRVKIRLDLLHLSSNNQSQGGFEKEFNFKRYFNET